MYIHLGGDTVVPLRDVVAICSVEKGSRNNRAFLRHIEKKKKVLSPEHDDIKSFVVTTSGIYYSSISSITLKKRALTPFEQL